VQETFLNRDGPYGRQRCAHVAVELGALVTSNGTRQIVRYCLDCRAKLSGAIAYSILRDELGIDPATVPVFRDQEKELRPCEACGEPAHLHQHHWAPKHLFPDLVEQELAPSPVFPDGHTYSTPEYELWPKSFLCPSCHERWHRIVTPDMSRKKAS
jgi:hypothetical protein